jgi:hypothetical protein
MQTVPEAVRQRMAAAAERVRQGGLGLAMPEL